MNKTIRRTIAWLALTAMLAPCFAGCAKKAETVTPDTSPEEVTARAQDGDQTQTPAGESAETPESGAYDQVYTPVLDRVYDVLTKNLEEENDNGDGIPMGVFEMAHMARQSGNGALLMSVGYLIEDLNGDGVPELLIGTLPDGAQGLDRLGQVFGGCTVRDGEPVPFLDGWSRNVWRWMGGARFYNFASNGAATSGFGTYRLDPGAAELRCEEHWFSDIADENTPEEVAFFYNTTGSWDKNASEKLDLDGDAFWALSEQTEGECRALPLTPMAQYEPVTVPAFAGGSKVFAAFLDDIAPALDHYTEAEGDFNVSEYGTTVVFYTFAGVKDFRLLSMNFSGIDDDGHAAFDTAEIYSVPELTADEPLAIPMDFPGDIPTSGFSYAEADGTVRTFLLGISGKDGSLYITSAD